MRFLVLLSIIILIYFYYRRKTRSYTKNDPKYDNYKKTAYNI